MEFQRTRYVFVVLFMLSLWVNCTVADEDFPICNYKDCMTGCDAKVYSCDTVCRLQCSCSRGRKYVNRNTIN